MKKIMVLGPGCPRCETLAKLTRQAADDINIEYEFEKVTNIGEFLKYGMMMTPGLVVDGELKVQGKIPSLDELKSLLT